jgi:hypothetical protein
MPPNPVFTKKNIFSAVGAAERSRHDTPRAPASILHLHGFSFNAPSFSASNGQLRFPRRLLTIAA